MSEYIITGGRSFNGRVRISGNKNAALPCLAASLLTDEQITLENVPMIQDVSVMIKLLQELGSQVTGFGNGRFHIKSDICFNGLSSSLVDSVRGSILLAGPLLARGIKVVIPPPGGDVIGLRRLDSHFTGLSALGVRCSVLDNGDLELTPPPRLKASDIFLDEASVTATENCIMAASLADGVSTIYNAACEPHIQNLCRMLMKMGCRIDGIGSNYLTVHGIASLSSCVHTISFDYMECGSFIGLAASTGSQLTLTGVDISQLKPIEKGFSKLGISFEKRENEIFVPADQDRVIARNYTGVTEKLDDAPWPGFPADLLSIMCVTATQMEGSILIHEKRAYSHRQIFHTVCPYYNIVVEIGIYGKQTYFIGRSIFPCSLYAYSCSGNRLTIFGCHYTFNVECTVFLLKSEYVVFRVNTEFKFCFLFIKCESLFRIFGVVIQINVGCPFIVFGDFVFETDNSARVCFISLASS